MTVEQLRNWRASLRLTQLEAALKLGVPVSSFREWEQGRRKPPNLLNRACADVTRTERDTFGTLQG